MCTSQIDEMIFEDPLFFERGKLLEDLLADHAAVAEGNELTGSSNCTKKRKSKHSSASRNQENNNINDCKKTMHRDIERQRRKEMAALYASLRSLLPSEYTKGKRSMSDRIHEAINYIKHKQKYIRELQMRRDKLKKLSSLSGLGCTNGADQDYNWNNIKDWCNCANVNYCRDGMEILISCCLNEEGFHALSKVLAELIEIRGLNIISCLSNRSNERLLHKIQIQATDRTCLGLSGLEWRLASMFETGNLRNMNL